MMCAPIRNASPFSHENVRLGELRAARAHGLHFPALQGEPGLEASSMKYSKRALRFSAIRRSVSCLGLAIRGRDCIWPEIVPCEQSPHATSQAFGARRQPPARHVRPHQRHRELSGLRARCTHARASKAARPRDRRDARREARTDAVPRSPPATAWSRIAASRCRSSPGRSRSSKASGC